MREVILFVCLFFLLLCERSAKRDMWHILLHNDKTTRNVTAPCSICGVVLQRFECIKLYHREPIKEACLSVCSKYKEINGNIEES